MKSVFYYSFEDKISDGLNHNSRESIDMPIMVNCTGRVNILNKFKTHNKAGRLDYYLLYVISGRLKVMLDSGERVFEGGDFVIFPPRYKYVYTSSGSAPLIYYFAHFTGSYAGELLSKLFPISLPAGFTAGRTDKFSDLFERLFAEFSAADSIRDISLGVALENILIELSKCSSCKNKELPLSHSVAYIRGAYTDEIMIPELAAMEGLSVSRYNTVFRETFGTSPVKFITDLRMKQACDLLASTDLSVKEIGRAVGYEDSHFFSKAFKKYLGISPTDFRKRLE